jgi:hypothetical protein
MLLLLVHSSTVGSDARFVRRKEKSRGGPSHSWIAIRAAVLNPRRSRARRRPWFAQQQQSARGQRGFPSFRVCCSQVNGPERLVRVALAQVAAHVLDAATARSRTAASLLTVPDGPSASRRTSHRAREPENPTGKEVVAGMPPRGVEIHPNPLGLSRRTLRNTLASVIREPPLDVGCVRPRVAEKRRERFGQRPASLVEDQSFPPFGTRDLDAGAARGGCGPASRGTRRGGLR